MLVSLVISVAFAQEYRLGHPDVLRFEVVGEDEMVRTLVVSSNGTVELPLTGALSVDGLTLEEARIQMQTALSDGFYRKPQVLLKVETYRSQPVTVHGAVRTPGTYYLDGPTHLSEMLAEAGGIQADEGTASTVRVIRTVDGGANVEEVRLEALMQGEGEDPLLVANDKVAVPLLPAVFVQGEVKSPGGIAFRQGMTASQALSEAGGHLNTALLRDAHLLRDGKRIPLNLKRVLAGKVTDIELKPGDQLVVPESVF